MMKRSFDRNSRNKHTIFDILQEKFKQRWVFFIFLSQQREKMWNDY